MSLWLVFPLYFSSGRNQHKPMHFLLPVCHLAPYLQSFNTCTTTLCQGLSVLPLPLAVPPVTGRILQEADAKVEIIMQGLYEGVPLSSRPMEENKRKQDWTKGETEMGCSLNEASLNYVEISEVGKILQSCFPLE